MSKNKIDYSVRYAPNYSDRVAAAHRLHKITGKGLCVCCFQKPAEEIHHTSYGDDRLGTSWFPVCLDCHKSILHHQDNWIRLPGEEAVWGNTNTPKITQALQRNYKALAQKVAAEQGYG